MVSRIEDYGLLGDLHTAALVDRNGSIDWLCLPRFDAPACFAALLGDERHGFWRLGPAAGGVAARRRYRGDSLVLESEWDTPDGTVRVVDCMPPRGEAADVVRVVDGVTGRVPVHMALRLRFDYGRIVPWVRDFEGQLSAVAGPDAAWLRTPVPLRGEDFATYADFEVAAGQRVPFVLTYRPSHEPTPRCPDTAAPHRYAWATPPPGSSSWTCGARPSTGCTWPGRPGSSRTRTRGTCSVPCWTTSRGTGATRTTGCGRSAAPGSTSCIPR